jgi:histone deacetylase HOS3
MSILSRLYPDRKGWRYGPRQRRLDKPCRPRAIYVRLLSLLVRVWLTQASENIHLQPYTSEADFYERIYPKYSALLDKAKGFMQETGADAERTVVLIR